MMTREYGKGYDEGYADGLKDAPQRTWEVLTNGEIYNAYIEAANQTLRPQDERIALAFARAIEALSLIHI
jgi:hypothetical protein